MSSIYKPKNRYAPKGLETVRTGHMTEKERDSEDFDWSYKHSKEITDEYQKLLKQQKVNEYDTKRKIEVHEIARQKVKDRYGVTGF